MVISISSIHGFSHITKKNYHPIERFIWAVLVSCSAYAIVSISKISLDRYNENPTVISMERDSFSWNTSFPAATICPLKKVNEDYLETYLQNSTNIKDKNKYRKFVHTLLSANYENFDAIVDYENMTGDDFLGIIKKFRFRFNFNSAVKITLPYNLQMSITELGVCYSFNSRLAVYNSPE